MVAILTTNRKRNILTLLVIGSFVVVLSVVGFAADDVQTPSQLPDDEQTPSKQAKIGYRNVGSVVSSVTGAEVDKKALVKEALANLDEELADHMK